ncbi:MAG: right-handed parallel beta-helix repeat-containing protein, partial [Thermoplasmatota archaeon]
MKTKKLATLILVAASLAVVTFLVFGLRFGFQPMDAGAAVPPPIDIFVDDDYDALTDGWHVYRWDNIQEAVDNATSGDTIFVYSGIYYENIEIDKSLTLQGEDRNTTIIDGGYFGDVLYVNSNNVIINSFTILNAGSEFGDAGIEFYNGSSCHIEYNTISSNWWYAIFLNYSCSNCDVANNTIIDNFGGVYLDSTSHDNFITGNTIRHND